MIPMFQDVVESQFDQSIIDIIDKNYQVNGTLRRMPFLANVTLDWSCEKDSIELNMEEQLSILLNGTFFNELSNTKT